jgi:hypothetical protein
MQLETDINMLSARQIRSGSKHTKEGSLIDLLSKASW